MTASALNSASFVPPGPRGPNAAALGLGGATGFDALLAALTPQPGQPQGDAAAATTTPGLPTPALANLPAALTGEAALEADADGASSEDPAIETPADADPSIVVDAPVVPVPTTQAGAAPTTSADPNAAPAHGRDKAKGSAAAPALLNANPNARLAEKADLKADTADDNSAAIDAPQLPTPATGSTPAPPKAQAAVQAPASAGLPTPNAADAAVDAAAPPAPLASADTDVGADGPVTPTQSTDRAPAQANAPGVQTPPRGDTPALSPLRSSRAERRGMTEEATPSADAKPTAASARSAAAIDPAARAAAAAAAAANAGTEAVAAAETAATESDPTIDGADAAPAVEARAASHTDSAGATSSQAPVRGSPETVANLAAQIVKKLEGRSTRFDVELNPDGLGKVDVRIEIGAQGRMTAALVFDNSQAAQDLKARANDLQRALEQAGFDLTGGLSFDVAHDQGQGRQQQAWQEAQGELGKSFRGQAFRAALENAGDADVAANGALRLRRGVNAGLDVRI